MKRLILLSLIVVLGSSVCIAQKRFKRTPAPLAKNIIYKPSTQKALKVKDSKVRVTGPKAKNTTHTGNIRLSNPRLTGPKAKNRRY